ncbi:hypothetical protein CRG98_043646 [Punica granatum]|uniref:Uncharacterized protein n=1 Tax=Punica granatum TaxID=22663 RepID=A0A2I0HW82_PUNGR|nr:hypothetical protein CRG98_043646 [Punica granatum]
MRARGVGGRVRPDRQMTRKPVDSRDDRWTGRSPRRCLTTIHTPNQSRLPHRPYLEQDSDSGLDPIPHSGCTRSMCVRALDPVIDGFGALDPVQCVT